MANLPGLKMPKDCFSTDKPLRNTIAFGLAILLTTTLSGCRDRWDKEKTYDLQTESVQKEYIRMADSISYGVVIKNRDTADEWQKKWLQNLDREKFVDFIFEAVYSGRLQPYDYFTDEPIPIRAVRELEEKEEFDRSRIGKIQFEERWYFDKAGLNMIKEVYGVMFAYEVYKEDGRFRGYKPAFKVLLRENLKKPKR